MSRLHYAQVTLACVAAMLFVMFVLQPTSAPEQALQAVPCMRPRVQIVGTSRQLLRPSASKKNIVPRRKMMQLGGLAAALSLAKAAQAADGFSDIGSMVYNDTVNQPGPRMRGRMQTKPGGVYIPK